LCAREIDVPGSLARVIRVLLTVSGVPAGKRLAPVYLDGAAALRPELAQPAPPARGTAPVPEETVAIIGLGQIGGSIGLALGACAGWRRLGFDADRSTLAAARAGGAIDVAAESIEAACASAALAVLAVPVDVLPGVVDRAAAALPRGAALIDTGSARSGVTEALARAAARGVCVIGGHPLAGGEGHGFAAARPGVFEGASFVVCPVDGEVPAIAARLIEDLGATPIRCDAERHDQALARTSHLPYLVARALRSIGEPAAREGLAGPAYRDVTRVASSDARMAVAYCRANGPNIRAAWQELRAKLDAEIAAL